MIIYFYLLIPLLFVSTGASSIRGRNNKNDLVPFTSSRTDPEKKGGSMKTVSSEPFFVKLHLPTGGETRGKDKKRKRPVKKRVSKIKPLGKRQRTRRELQISKSIREEHSNPLKIPQPVNTTEMSQNFTNAISKVDLLKALSSYSKQLESKRTKTEDVDDPFETVKHIPSNRNHHIHNSEQMPLVKMVYPSTPNTDRHPHKYTYRDLINDRERLEQKIKYIKNMLSLNDSAVDDSIRVRRRSDSDRAANRIAKMFLTLSAVNGLHDRRKSKCEEDEEDRVQDIWEKDRKESSSRKSSSSNEERYKVKKWIEFMKNKRSSGKTCPCMAMTEEERDAFPLEQKLPKGYFLMERRDSSEESSETSRDQLYSPKDKLSRTHSLRRNSKAQDDQDSKVKGKNGKKKSDATFTDLEVYRSRAKQILRNAEEILDRIKEEEEKRLSAPNLFMSQLRELTSRIHGDPRNNENDLIRKLQKNLGWGPLSKSEEGADGNQFMENVKSFILDPYEKAKALTDESTKKLSSYLLRNLGKIQTSEEQTDVTETEDNADKANLKVYFGQVPPKEEEKQRPDSLAKDSKTDSLDTEKNDADRQQLYKQKMEDIIKQQQQKLEEYETTKDSEETKKEAEGVDGKETDTVRETQKTNLEDKVEMQLTEHDVGKTFGSKETATKPTDELELEKAPGQHVDKKPLLQSEGIAQGEKGDNKGTTSGNLQAEEKRKEQILLEMKPTVEDADFMVDDPENVEKQRSDVEVQTREELTQSKHDEDPKDQMQVVEPLQKSSPDTSERDENDVVASPHLADDYEFLSERENEDYKNPTLLTEFYPTWTDEMPTGRAFEEIPIQTKSNDETVLVNFEPELGRSQSGEFSNLDYVEGVGLAEPVFEKNSMEIKESADERQGEEMIQLGEGAKQPLEYADLVKGVSQASEESSEIGDVSPQNKSNEEEAEGVEETLKMEQTSDEDNKSTADRIDRAKTDGETLLKLASDMEDPENLQRSQDEEDSDNTPLRVPLEESSKNSETPKEAQDEQQSFESDETALRAENPDTSMVESSEESVLKQALENFARNEETEVLRTEETDNQELAKNADEDGTEETLLKEAKGQKSVETEMTGATSNDRDETELREASFEENVNEKAAANEEDEGEPPLKAVRDEGKQEGNSSQEVSEKATPKDEEILRSENALVEEDDQMNQEKESSQEVMSKNVQEESQENLKLEKPEVDDFSEDLEKETENMKDEILKAADPRESLEDQMENVDNEPNLKAEKPVELDEELETPRSEEIVEETSDETMLQRSNPEEKLEEEQNSFERVREALENEMEVDGDDTLKAAKPEDVDQKSDENLNVDDSETVKAALDDHEEQDRETVKADMGNENQELEGEEVVKAQNSREKVEETEDESVRGALDDENLRGSDEEEKSEENFEGDDTVREAMEDQENLNQYETIPKEANSKEELEEVLGSTEKVSESSDKTDQLVRSEAAQTGDEETPLTVSQENLQEETETLRAENPREDEQEGQFESNESLRSASLEDDMDNKIDFESVLRSPKTMDEFLDMGDSNEEEIPRENANNGIDDENDETLKSENLQLQQSAKSSSDSDEKLKDDPLNEDDSPLQGVNPLKKQNVEENGRQVSDVLQMAEPASKPLKSRLKVPKSIGKIMNDLEGETKDEITSLQHLNPDKIDDIIDKIDEAEQKNLLGGPEVDCRKECACAEEMNTRSRNIGRYEIVKDFLHWMKDLQLNRVLSDD